MIVDYAKDDVYQHQIYWGLDTTLQWSGSAGTLTTAYATYKIEVDWNNDGDFIDTYDDITADVKEIRFSRGKNEELDKAETGRLDLRVNNAAGKYSPEYSSGVLYGNLLPKRTIRVYDSITGLILFYGYIEEIIPHPHLDEQDAFISAVDGLDFLARHELDTVLYKDELTGALVTNILDAAGWSDSLRSIDAGQDTVPYGYWHQVKALTALGDIEDSELGFIYVSGSGQLAFEDRHHRYTATHQTSQATFSDTMTDLTYDYSARNVYNEIRATITPWELQSEAELWRLAETPSIAIGQTSTFWGNSEYFVDAWVTPVATTDYTANSQADGLGDDETANITIVTTKFAKSIKLAITNDTTHIVYITKLLARGTYYDDKTKISLKSEDSTSQTAYQKRTLTLDGKYLTNVDTGQNFCDYAIARFKDPQAEVSMTLVNKNATLLTQILTREISDRITVVNTKLGMSKDFLINKMEHEILEGGKSHTCTYQLVDATNEDFWCWGYSKWGVSTKWGY